MTTVVTPEERMLHDCGMLLLSPLLNDGGLWKSGKSQTESLAEPLAYVLKRRLAHLKPSLCLARDRGGYSAACDLTRHHLADSHSMVTLLDEGPKWLFPHR